MAPDSEIFAKVDTQVLDCTICSEPLNPPIYQVINHHTHHSVSSTNFYFNLVTSTTETTVLAVPVPSVNFPQNLVVYEWEEIAHILPVLLLKSLWKLGGECYTSFT